jgi:uncharacterized Zn-finger protein
MNEANARCNELGFEEVNEINKEVEIEKIEEVIEEIEMLEEHLDDIIEYEEIEDEIKKIEMNFPYEEIIFTDISSSKSSININNSNFKKKINYNHQCLICNAKFVSARRLDLHLKVKHTQMSEEEKLECLTCNKKFKVQEYLELHIRNQHTDNPMKHRQPAPCSVCGKILKSGVALRNHENKHVIDAMPEDLVKKFSCDLCGMRFRLKSYVFNHMSNVHLRNKYPCTFPGCSKGFYKKYELNEHIVRFHTNERPILCEYEGCGKSFARQKNYQIHKVRNLKFSS